MKYLSIDIETTGLNPKTSDIVQFAAVIDDLKNPKPLQDLPKFEAILLKSNGYQGEPYALSMHSKLFMKIDRALKKNLDTCPETNARFMFLEDLSNALECFLLSNDFQESSNGKIYVNVAGKNVGQFDLPFLKEKVTDWGKIKFLSRIIDPAILFFDISHDASLPDMKTCVERAGLSEEVAHTALEDALLVVKLIRKKLLPKEENVLRKEKNTKKKNNRS